MKLRAIILRNEFEKDHILWIKACDKYSDQIEYRVVNLTSGCWFEEIHKEPFDILLAKPGGLTSRFKSLYDERIYILGKVLNYNIFPSVEEILIYENKRFLSYWLKAKKIPHPETFVFYFQKEALDFISSVKYPIVAKTNIGASGSGISILKDSDHAKSYIKKSFSKKGAPQRIGPNLNRGGLLTRGIHYLFHPANIKPRFQKYVAKFLDPQSGFVIFQKFIPHDFEWRVVRIGDSYFAHKKMKVVDKASGTLVKSYDKPPVELFDFVRLITDENDLSGISIDIFEHGNEYLVNEIQCIFGQSDPYQMLIDGNPGRYVFSNNSWIFECGNFNENESYNLRVETVIKTLSTRKFKF